MADNELNGDVIHSQTPVPLNHFINSFCHVHISIAVAGRPGHASSRAILGTAIHITAPSAPTLRQYRILPPFGYEFGYRRSHVLIRIEQQSAVSPFHKIVTCICSPCPLSTLLYIRLLRLSRPALILQRISSGLNGRGLELCVFHHHLWVTSSGVGRGCARSGG